MTPRPSGTEGYGETADRLAGAYESVTFAQVHHATLPFFPTAPSRVLDIGAGTGRDAAALAALGHSVLAVEPTDALRSHGQRLHSDSAITWLGDALPDLALVRARGERFDLVLLSAVWMHLDLEQREHGMAHLAPLGAPDGLMTISLRHGPVPAGRRMFAVSAAETIALASRHGLLVIHESERASAFKRSDVRWTDLAFRFQGQNFSAAFRPPP